MKAVKKGEVITFKVDESLARELERLPNRSEFIRAAILGALENAWPLCHGTGRLSPNQRRHWDAFVQDHPLAECADCHEWFISCEGDGCAAPTPADTEPCAEPDTGAGEESCG